MPAVSQGTTTTVVNAAFLQEVKESNLQLWTTLRELRAIEADAAEPREASRDFVAALSELRDHIGLQFSLEETYGFIEGSPTTSTFGVAQASTAKTQHRELYLQLHEICEQVEEAQYRGTIARDLPIYLGAFEQFDLAFKAHEDLESELIRCGLGVSKLDF